MTPPDLSVVIVHYQTPKLLARCLQALRPASSDLDVEVFVVDNASENFDAKSPRRILSHVRVIVNDENVGFATASNQALRQARGRYVLLLNPDALVADDTLTTMVRYMDEHPEVGAATCRLELADGSLDRACRRLFPTPKRALYRLTLLSRLFPASRRFGQYNLTYLDEWQETEIDTPCGAFMVVRSQVCDEVGLLDETYFMYGEDMDWAYRMKAAGWKVMYVPSATATHYKRASSSKYRHKTIRYFYSSMRIFYRHHYQSIYPWWVTQLVMGAISTRERIELLGNVITRRKRREAH